MDQNSDHIEIEYIFKLLYFVKLIKEVDGCVRGKTPEGCAENHTNQPSRFKDVSKIRWAPFSAQAAYHRRPLVSAKFTESTLREFTNCTLY